MTKNAPRLVQCASPWSLMGYPSSRREWSLKRKMEAIKEAGFDGIAAVIDPETKRLADELGLVTMGGFDGSNLQQARRQLIAQKALGVHYMNVQLLDHDTPPAKAAALAVKLLKLSDRHGVGVHIETHRDTATETPEKYTEIARLFQRETGRLLPTTWDHSHLSVIKHLVPAEYASRLLAWPKLIQHSHIFHLRPFNGQHCQVPVTNGHGRLTPEFKDYLVFVQDLFSLWLKGSPPRGELWVSPEMGCSHGYHLSTNPSPWQDAIVARKEYAKVWQRTLRQARMG